MTIASCTMVGKRSGRRFTRHGLMMTGDQPVDGGEDQQQRLNE